MNIDWLKPVFDSHSRIVNIVAVSDFHRHIDLHITHKFWRDSILEPKKIPCVRAKFNFKLDNTVALIYHSGKVVFTGFKHIHTLKKAFHLLNLFLLQHLTLPLTALNFAIANVVATININQIIDIQALITKYPQAHFDSQIFPAAQLKTFGLINAKSTLLFYANGKIVVAGANKLFKAHCILQYAIFHILKDIIHIDRFNDSFFNLNDDKNYCFSLAWSL